MISVSPPEVPVWRRNGTMLQTEETGTGKDLKQAINNLCFPALNVLRGIELDLQDHPCCPYRQMAEKAAVNLMRLLELANKQGEERGA